MMLVKKEKNRRLYLGPEFQVLLCSTVHMLEGRQVVEADGGRLHTNRQNIKTHQTEGKKYKHSHYKTLCNSP